MPSTVLYEVRTIGKNKIDREYAKSLSQVFSLLRDAGSSRRVYKIYKDLDGKVLRSEELNCKIKGKGLVVKTIKTKPVKKVPDRNTGIFTKIPLSKKPQDNGAILPHLSRLKAKTVGRAAKTLTSMSIFRGPQSSGVIIRLPRHTSQRTTFRSEHAAQTRRPAGRAASGGSSRAQTRSVSQEAARGVETSQAVRAATQRATPRRAPINRAGQARPATSRQGRSR